MKKRREAEEEAAPNQRRTAAVWGARARLGRVLGWGLAAARVRGLGARMGARAQRTHQIVQVWPMLELRIYVYILFLLCTRLWASLLEVQQRHRAEMVATYVHWHPMSSWIKTGVASLLRLTGRSMPTARVCWSCAVCL